MQPNNNELLINIENLSKKFARDLKRSLWYGVKEISQEMIAAKRNDLKLRKDEFWALKDISLQVRRGEVVSIIGSNGAGKTTLLRLIDGLIKPDKGKVSVRGRIGALIALGTGFNPILTGRENVFINAAVLGIPRQEILKKFDSIVEFAELGDAIDMPVQYYSSGMVVRLGFSVGVHLEPDILLIDEVLSVGDLAFNQKSLRKSLALVTAKTCGIVFISHKLFAVQQISDRVIWIDKGQIKMQGNPQDILPEYEKEMATIAGTNFNGKDSSDIKSKYNHIKDEIFLDSQSQVKVENCYLTNTTDEKKEKFKSEESMFLHFKFAYQKLLNNPKLVIRVLKEDGMSIWHYHYPGELSPIQSAYKKMVLNIPRIQLLSGTYILSVQLYEDHTPVAFSKPVIFSVTGNPERVLNSFSTFEPHIDVVSSTQY